MKRPNIIHICDKFGVRGSTTHGVSRLFSWWFPEFDYDKYNVKLYALKTPDSASRSLEESGVKLTYLGKDKIRPSILNTFLRVIREEEADVLHLHGWIAANFGRLAGKITGVPTIMHEHGVDPKFPSSQRFADRILAAGCNHTAVAVSRAVHDFLIANRYVPASKIRIVYNGAPLSEFSHADPKEVERVRREFDLPAGSRLVGTVGRLDTQKGITYFIEAAKMVKDAVPNAHFLVVGDGPRKEEYRNQVADLGLSECVTFTGHRSDVSAVLALLDVQVFASLWEGLPLTLFEAMGMGRSIVSTTADGLGEALTDGKDALLVEPAKSDQLASAVIRMLGDSHLAKALGEGASKRSKDFDNKATVRELEALYDELCASRGAIRG